MTTKLSTSIAALAVLLSCTAEGAGPRPTTLEERGRSGPSVVDVHLDGRLVFSAEGDIWTMHADGSRRRKLTTHPAEDFDPVWSPDGMRIAFRSHRDGDEEVYVMRADGSDERNLTRSPTSDYSPAWSPDGSRLAFHCSLGGINPNGTADFEICTVNLDGSGLVRITNTEGENTQPNWSPDGEWIAFESNRLGWPTLPDATPEGYEPDAFGDEDVWIMRPDGSAQRNLTRNPLQDDTFPVWSRDGSWILFTRYGTLHVVDPDGMRQAEVPNSPGTDGFPDWIA